MKRMVVSGCAEIFTTVENSQAFSETYFGVCFFFLRKLIFTVKCVGSFISTDRAPLPELIPVTVAPGNN
jgi:hypothetical protein